MSQWCHFLKSMYCFCVSGEQEVGGGDVYHSVLTVCGDWRCFFVVFLCLMAKRFLCCAPNFLFSPLCLLSLSPLYLFLSCFCSFFRTNLHACLLIISLACLHDVESQAKLLASSSHHCLWCLSKLAWPIPGHPLTLDLSSTWFFCMYILFFFFFLVCFFLYRNVTGGREVKQINVKNLPALNSFKTFFLFCFCKICFFANVLKTCGISYF